MNRHATEPLAPQFSAGRALEEARASIVDIAAESIRHGKTHYEAAGPDETRRRLEALYDQLLAAVSSRDLSGIVGYARRLAAERFSSGYDLTEVQGAFNALEEATWLKIVTELPADRHSHALSVVSTVFGAGKDMAWKV